MQRRNRILLAAGAAGLLLVGLSPMMSQANRMLTEGYPQHAWPAPGAFADVAGRDAPFPHGVDISPSLNGRARAIFHAKQGKALLLFHGGRLKLEHYAAGVTKDSRFNSYSMVKSLVGALMLKAVDEGRIKSLDAPVGQYLPLGLGGKRFRATSLQAFLRMRSGVNLESKPRSGAGASARVKRQLQRANPLGALTSLHFNGLDAIGDSLRVTRQQGEYSYQNVNTAILGRALEAAYDKPLEKLLAEKIWMPAGAAPAYWRRYDRDKRVTAYCCLYDRPRDWVLVGLYLMRNGEPGARFLSKASYRRYFGLDLRNTARQRGAYGAQIYHNILDRKGEALQGPFTYMNGARGQTVYMMPQKELVVVRVGEKIQWLHSTLYSAWNSVYVRRRR